jgi:hypothetical protein
VRSVAKNYACGHLLFVAIRFHSVGYEVVKFREPGCTRD